MTDGVPNNVPQSEAASKAAQDAGITIIGVGVAVPGNGDQAIKRMVSDPKDDHYVSVDNAQFLNTKLAEIVKSVCIVHCEGIWGSWGVCNKQTGQQERLYTETQAADEGGDACPKREVQLAISSASFWKGIMPTEES